MKTAATTLVSLFLLTLTAGGQEADIYGFDWVPGWEPPVVHAFPRIRALELEDQAEVFGSSDDLPEENLTRGIKALLSDLPSGRTLSDADIVREIGRYLEGRAVVAVAAAWLPEGRTRPPADAAAVAKALKEGGAELLWSGRFETRRGAWVAKEDIRLQTLIARMEVEVAQEASIAEPITAEITLGTRVAVQCLPETGDSATVRLSLQIAFTPENDETVRTSTGTIDLVEVPFVSLFAGMNLRHGKPHLIVLDHPVEEGLIAVTVNLVETHPVKDLPFLLVDMSAAAGEPEVAPQWEWTGIRAIWDKERYHAVAQPFVMARVELTELAQSLPVKVRLLTSTVAAVTGKGEGLGKASLVLSAHSEDVERVRDRMPWEELSASSNFDLLTGSFFAGNQPTDRFHLRVPVLDGSATLLHSGIWRLFLSGEKVEIAQAAAIHQPHVGIHFEGESLRLTGSRPARVEQTTSRLMDRERREIDVRKDVLGKRERERSHLVDFLRTVDTRRSLTVGPRGATTVRREEDEAVVEVWR